jgi:sulfur relay (sulfurtransferase) DsrC/TusE family protein
MCVLSGSTTFFSHYLINGTSLGKTLSNVKCVLISSATFSETFFIVRRIQRVIIISVHRTVCNNVFLVRLLWNLWDYYETCETIMRLVRLLWDLWDYYETCETIMKLVRLLWNLWDYYETSETIMKLVRLLRNLLDYYETSETIMKLVRLLWDLWDYYKTCETIMNLVRLMKLVRLL